MLLFLNGYKTYYCCNVFLSQNILSNHNLIATVVSNEYCSYRGC